MEKKSEVRSPIVWEEWEGIIRYSITLSSDKNNIVMVREINKDGKYLKIAWNITKRSDGRIIVTSSVERRGWSSILDGSEVFMRFEYIPVKLPISFTIDDLFDPEYLDAELNDWGVRRVMKYILQQIAYNVQKNLLIDVL